MRSKRLSDTPTKTFVVVFDTGEEVSAGLLEFARRHSLSSSHVTAIGAFSEVTLGFCDIQQKDYKKIPVPQQVEVVSLTGNIVLHGEEPKFHAHVVVSRRDGTALGGHLLKARVRPTVEVVIVELPEHLRRRADEETGLALIDLDAGEARQSSGDATP